MFEHPLVTHREPVVHGARPGEFHTSCVFCGVEYNQLPGMDYYSPDPDATALGKGIQVCPGPQLSLAEA